VGRPRTSVFFRHFTRPIFFKCAALSSSSATSSSVVCVKSSYHCPTEKNGLGVLPQIISCTSLRKWSQVSFEATGTATVMDSGWNCPRALTAARMLDPVAKPSSTRIQRWLAISAGLRCPRYSFSRRFNSANSLQRPPHQSLFRESPDVARPPRWLIKVPFIKAKFLTTATGLDHSLRLQSGAQITKPAEQPLDFAAGKRAGQHAH
jgi:hypothetical protein